jgi:pyruvate-formate lyase-activating enzyme
MKIDYQKPWFLKPKLTQPQTNVIANNNYTISLTFKVDKTYKKDNKIGFFGIPGKNFGISYDYGVDLFVFEYWTKKKDENEEDKFHCHVYDCINDKALNKGLNITLTYDGQAYKLYKDFKLFDTIINSDLIVDDYINEPIYIGCHNMDSLNEKHKCITEMDVYHFSIFNKALDNKTIENLVTNHSYFLNSSEYDDNYCYYDLSNSSGDEFLLYDGVKDLTFLKKKNKMSSVGFELVKDKLDAVGCGFCLAKWTQVTMHLHNGTTHSCHHPEPHKVGLEEIKINPTALHNSKIKKQARKQMLNNERPSECQYCWNVEDNSSSFSDRTYKSSEPWSEPYYNEISKSDWRENYNPKYVEVSFSNTCNFKCAYCGPEYSSKWMEEINEHGAYDLSFTYNGIDRMVERNTKPYKQSEQNPYVDAFWEWFPELYSTLDTFRITGGEPLLSKDTWKVLDFIINSETPNKNLKLSINSNLGVPDELVDKLIEKLDKIIVDNKVKELIIFTSCDGYGKQSEYTRYGMDFDKLFHNIDKVLKKLPRVTIVVMSTFNIFSIFSYEQLIKKIHKMKIKHFNTKRYWNSAIILDTSYLRHPPFLSFRILKDYITTDYFDRWIKYMKFNSTFRSLNFHKTQLKSDIGFSTQEIEKIIRIKDIFLSDYEVDIKLFDKDKKDFVNFIRQYEIRRNVVCEDYYPELIEFIKNIENENKI